MQEHVLGFFAPWGIYLALLALHLLLPARHIDGYVREEKTGLPLRYRLNGLLVFFIAVGIWASLSLTNLIPLDWLSRHRWSSFAGACTLGLLASALLISGAPRVSSSLPVDFFLGRRLNPQFFSQRVDAKMFLYLAGATLLGLNILSLTAEHLLAHPENASPGLLLHCALFLWFLLDYLSFERVHLYTYDLFAERVGFKLTWGCLTFYPYFYAIGLFATAELPNPARPLWWHLLSAALFLCGWCLARGANLQKFIYKTAPHRAFLGILKPEVITDGKRSLLCSGFWGVSRHVNYLGELLMAAGLTLALGHPSALVVWLYPLYYVALLVPRQIDDDRRCQLKYGALWTEYTRRVPYRIVPGLY